MSYKKGFLLLVGLFFAGFALIFVPAYLIQPFELQTKQEVLVSYYFRKLAPFLTVLLSVVSLVVLIKTIQKAKRLAGKITPILPVLLLILCSVFSFQNYFQWMFHPLDNPNYGRPQQVSFLKDDDMVLASAHGSDSVAYPVRILAYHHMVNDRVGGKPVVATY
jgi:hypothetical protein